MRNRMKSDDAINVRDAHAPQEKPIDISVIDNKSDDKESVSVDGNSDEAKSKSKNQKNKEVVIQSSLP